MARATRKKEESPLLKALKFVALAQEKDSSLPYQTHCRIGHKKVMAFDGILAACAPIPDELDHCPNTHKLIAALERISGQYSLAAVQEHQLTIKSGSFRANIPCIGLSDIQIVHPDNPVGAFNDKFKQALIKAGLFTTEGAQTVTGASLRIESNSVVGTNGKVIIEAWHGIHMPSGLLLPKSFANALVRIDTPLQSFGFSEGSFTAYFEDGCWLKTQLYQETWPNVGKFLDETKSATAIEPPKEMFDAIKAVAPHSEGSFVYFGQDQIQSHRDEKIGATFQCAGILPGQSVDHKIMNVLEPIIKRVDLLSNPRMIVFFGENVRGVIGKAN